MKVTININGAEELQLAGFDGLPCVLTSSIERSPGQSVEAAAFNAALDGVEALVLALFEAGIDMRSPLVQGAIRTALERIAND